MLIIVLGVYVFWAFANRPAQGEELTIGEFENELADGNIETATFHEADQEIVGEMSDGTPYETTYPLDYQKDLIDELKAADVPFESDPQRGSALLGFLFQLIPVLLIVGAFIFIMNQSQGGGGRVMQFGKARAKLVTKDTPKTSFSDVAGVDEAIEELMEVKEYLQNPAKFQAMGAKIPRGVLLFGPPGAGKTLLARAVAGEAGVPFFSISGSDFVEMFVGVGAARVRDLFEQAKQSAPAIVFIDEIDAVGRHRGAGLGGGHDEREQTLNQLLVEMDGFDQRTAVILMAATNRPDILDPALLRPGRFDRHVTVDRPDLEGRKAILNVHARGKPFDETVNLAIVARRTPGFTGADLANVINEAALLAARWGKKAVGMNEVEEAIDRVMAGPERKTPRDERAGEARDRLPRGRARARRPRAAEHRPRSQDQRHPARPRARLHAHAARGGQVPHDPRGARGRARDVDGRARGGGADRRRHHDRCRERHRARDQGREADGDRVRDE